ncbi:hypothetical protein [Pseudoalteromonas rubra]|uniref:hypothetical protein n=1 Tax=Pseudoalteromonas rubra TaxID=43658 RepID=UPI000F76A1A2|nr:hypothetical protein [Pseudoalteromonas rubra]
MPDLDETELEPFDVSDLHITPDEPDELDYSDCIETDDNLSLHADIQDQAEEERYIRKHIQGEFEDDAESFRREEELERLYRGS